MTKMLKNMIKGATSIFIIPPTGKYKDIEKKRYKPHKSISAAMRSDWEKVGGDLNRALDRAAHGEE